MVQLKVGQIWEEKIEYVGDEKRKRTLRITEILDPLENDGWIVVTEDTYPNGKVERNRWSSRAFPRKVKLNLLKTFKQMIKENKEEV